MYNILLQWFDYSSALTPEMDLELLKCSNLLVLLFFVAVFWVFCRIFGR